MRAVTHEYRRKPPVAGRLTPEQEAKFRERIKPKPQTIEERRAETIRKFKERRREAKEQEARRKPTPLGGRSFQERRKKEIAEMVHKLRGKRKPAVMPKGA